MGSARPVGLRGFLHQVARNQALWTVCDRSGHPAIVEGRGAAPVRPFWSSEALAQRLIESAPGYDGYDTVAIPWSEFQERVLPELEREGMLAGINWSGPESLGTDVAPAKVFEGVELARARLKDWERGIAATTRRDLYLRDALIGAAIGGFFAVKLCWSIAEEGGARSFLVLLLAGAVAGAVVPIELRYRSGWESRGLLWSTGRFVLSFTSAAGLVYGLGSWWLYPWSWGGLLKSCGLAALLGVAVRVGAAYQPEYRRYAKRQRQKRRGGRRSRAR